MYFCIILWLKWKFEEFWIHYFTTFLALLVTIYEKSLPPCPRRAQFVYADILTIISTWEERNPRRKKTKPIQRQSSLAGNQNQPSLFRDSQASQWTNQTSPFRDSQASPGTNQTTLFRDRQASQETKQPIAWESNQSPKKTNRSDTFFRCEDSDQTQTRSDCRVSGSLWSSQTTTCSVWRITGTQTGETSPKKTPIHHSDGDKG